jgi:hypothetical protein
MDMEAVLTLFSFAGFAALLVSWILAPMGAVRLAAQSRDA